MAKNSAAAVILLIAGMVTILQSKAHTQLQRTLQCPALLCIVIVVDVPKLWGQRGISQVLVQSTQQLRLLRRVPNHLRCDELLFLQNQNTFSNM